MNMFEELALFNKWQLIKAGKMNKDEVMSLVAHLATTALSGTAMASYLSGSDATALGSAAGVLAGIAYKVYLSKKLLNTPSPAAPVKVAPPVKKA